MRYIDATRDYTIVDVVRDTYRRLQFEQALHNIKKQQPKKKWWEIWN